MESETQNRAELAELRAIVEEQRIQIEQLQAEVRGQRESHSASVPALSDGLQGETRSARRVTRSRWLKAATVGVAAIAGGLMAGKKTAFAEAEPFAVETCRRVETTGVGGGGVGFNASPAANFASGAQCYGTQVGVMGFSRGPTGRGVFGLSFHGYGGFFQGFRAPVHLQASGAPIHPAAGLLGDLFVDATSRLWFCKGGIVWKQLA